MWLGTLTIGDPHTRVIHQLMVTNAITVLILLSTVRLQVSGTFMMKLVSRILS